MYDWNVTERYISIDHVWCLAKKNFHKQAKSCKIIVSML